MATRHSNTMDDADIFVTSQIHITAILMPWITNYTEHTSRPSFSPAHEFSRSPPIDDILNQLNPLHVTAYSFYFKTYRHLRLGLQSGLLPTTLVYVSYFPDACYMSGHSRPSSTPSLK